MSSGDYRKLAVVARNKELDLRQALHEVKYSVTRHGEQGPEFESNRGPLAARGAGGEVEEPQAMPFPIASGLLACSTGF